MVGYRPLGQTVGRDYARTEIKMRGELRKGMAESAVLVADKPGAKVCWTFERYYKKTYLTDGIKIVGWPKSLVWQNLSGITGLVQIAFLLQRWQDGTLYIARVTPAEREAALLDSRKAAPAPRCAHSPPKLGRRDLKSHKYRPKTNPTGRPGRYKRNGPKSAQWVTAVAEARAE
ncbi:hypothetical protein C8Q77DRAFT_1029096, partial [Trametes polyzona]